MKSIGFARDSGLSMIELLVALAISGFLILGISQIYIDNKRNHVFQQDQMVNQESARFAELLLDEYLGRVGYLRDPKRKMEAAFPSQGAANGCAAFDKGESVTAVQGGSGICIRYEPFFSGEPDCEGNASTAFSFVEGAKGNVFKSPETLIVMALRYEPAADATDLSGGRLTCESFGVGAPGAVELLTGVADLRLEFGIGASDLLTKALRKDDDPKRYVSAKTWQQSDGPIRVVRYSLLLAGKEGQREGRSRVLTEWKTAAPDSAARLDAGDRDRLYQIAGGELSLRNLMP